MDFDQLAGLFFGVIFIIVLYSIILYALRIMYKDIKGVKEKLRILFKKILFKKILLKRPMIVLKKQVVQI